MRRARRKFDTITGSVRLRSIGIDDRQLALHNDMHRVVVMRMFGEILIRGHRADAEIFKSFLRQLPHPCIDRHNVSIADATSM